MYRVEAFAKNQIIRDSFLPQVMEINPPQSMDATGEGLLYDEID